MNSLESTCYTLCQSHTVPSYQNGTAPWQTLQRHQHSVHILLCFLDVGCCWRKEEHWWSECFVVLALASCTQGGQSLLHHWILMYWLNFHSGNFTTFTHIGCSFLMGSGAALGPFIHAFLAASSSFAWITPPALCDGQKCVRILVCKTTERACLCAYSRLLYLLLFKEIKQWVQKYISFWGIICSHVEKAWKWDYTC